MYIQLSEGIVVDSEAVIAILDYQTIKDNEINQAFLSGQKTPGASGRENRKPVKSVILTDNHWYLSPFTAETVRKRAEWATMPLNPERSDES